MCVRIAYLISVQAIAALWFSRFRLEFLFFLSVFAAVVIVDDRRTFYRTPNDVCFKFGVNKQHSVHILAVSNGEFVLFCNENELSVSLIVLLASSDEVD